MAEAYKSNEKGLCIRGGRGKAVVISSRARGSRNGRGGGRGSTAEQRYEDADDESDEKDYEYDNDQFQSKGGKTLKGTHASVRGPFEGKKGPKGGDGYLWDAKPPIDTYDSFHEFTITPRLNKNVENCKTMLDFFNYFINDSMLEMVVLNTNLRLKKLNEKNIELTVTELRSFIGLLLLFGVKGKRKVEINEIWSLKSLHHENYATAAMSRNRFKNIASCLVYDDLRTRASR